MIMAMNPVPHLSQTFFQVSRILDTKTHFKETGHRIPDAMPGFILALV